MASATIRPAQAADAEALGRVHVEVWREAYAGIIPQTYLDRLSADERTQRWSAVIQESAQRTAFFAAWRDNELMGFAGGGPARDPKLGADGELFMINILRAAHGQGLGRSLVTHVARALSASGFRDMGLWVFLANTHARGFYKHLGGIERPDTHDVTFDDVTLQEYAVIWPDLNAFLKSASGREPLA